jgi:hypothetical protein
VRPIPRNSWGGASQALTALRAPRWFEFYGKPAVLSHLMNRWCEAIQRDMTLRPQIDPLTGEFTEGDLPNYSPAALLMTSFTWRLIGIREEPNQLEWNVRTAHTAAQGARFHPRFDKKHTASLSYENHSAVLRQNGRRVCQIDSGSVRLTTDKQGQPKSLAGISESVETISLRMDSHPAKNITIRPNHKLKLD